MKTIRIMIQKRLPIGLLSLLIFIISACQKEDTPACSYPKNAKLKRIVACRYIESECPSRECDDIGWIEEEYEYDGRDRIKKVMLQPKYEDGVLTNPTEYHLYEYNSKGQLVKIEFHHAIGSGNDLWYWHEKNHIYTYSNDGKKEKENIVSIEPGSFQYRLYKYTNNRLTKIENYKKNSDILESYILNEYDDSGNLIKETTLGIDGEQYHCMEHTYENGLNIQSNEYEGTMHTWEFLKSYDKSNNLVLVERFHKTVHGSLKYEYYD